MVFVESGFVVAFIADDFVGDALERAHGADLLVGSFVGDGFALGSVLLVVES